MNYKEFNAYIEKNAHRMTDVADGIYDVSDIEFIEEHTKNREEVIQWLIDREFKVWMAGAYETDTRIFLAEEPKKFKGELFGSGFNYGSTNIVQGCPKSILILAEND